MRCALNALGASPDLETLRELLLCSDCSTRVGVRQRQFHLFRLAEDMKKQPVQVQMTKKSIVKPLARDYNLTIS